jgi:hypothetical protein
VITCRFADVRAVYPVRVQGETAAPEIAQALHDLNRMGGLDVLVVARGGGSLEDLWAFNEEAVARAIAGSKIPVISAPRDRRDDRGLRGRPPRAHALGGGRAGGARESPAVTHLAGSRPLHRTMAQRSGGSGSGSTTSGAAGS